MNAPNTPNAQRPPANAQPAFKMQITRGALKEPERIIIHGAPGIGKSSLAAQMPRPPIERIQRDILPMRSGAGIAGSNK